MTIWLIIWVNSQVFECMTCLGMIRMILICSDLGLFINIIAKESGGSSRWMSMLIFTINIYSV